jgi:hypothetical protein
MFLCSAPLAVFIASQLDNRSKTLMAQIQDV